jgi:adenosylhomocysteine nucleosidase
MEAPKLLLVMALEIESQGLFAQRGVPVLYTGLGKVNAAYRLTRALRELGRAGAEPPMVVNFGTAGSRRFTAGSLVACRKFVQRDIDLAGLGFEVGHTPFEDVPPLLEFPLLFPELPEATCGTADRFETGEPAVSCDVVDMEGYALAKVCRFEGVTFGAVKYVTDGADGSSAGDWERNLPHAARAFAEHYEALLERLRAQSTLSKS